MIEKINYEQVEAIANKMKNSAGSMEQILGEVRALFNQIGNGEVWSGTAASYAKEKFDQLSSKFPNFYSATNECYNHLMSVIENYKNVDSRVSNG